MTLDTANGAPTARRVLCVDFDLTLVAWGPLDVIPEPLPGAVKAVRHLMACGYEVVILTSRMSATWWIDHCAVTGEDPIEFGGKQERIVQRSLERMGLGGLRVTAEKVPALAYIDDRAIAFHGDWQETLSHLLSVAPR